VRHVENKCLRREQRQDGQARRKVRDMRPLTGTALAPSPCAPPRCPDADSRRSAPPRPYSHSTTHTLARNPHDGRQQSPAPSCLARRGHAHRPQQRDTLSAPGLTTEAVARSCISRRPGIKKYWRSWALGSTGTCTGHRESGVWLWVGVRTLPTLYYFTFHSSTGTEPSCASSAPSATADTASFLILALLL
jgi:hypothetical protein